jgi:hypothetical protein
VELRTSRLGIACHLIPRLIDNLNLNPSRPHHPHPCTSKKVWKDEDAYLLAHIRLRTSDICICCYRNNNETGPAIVPAQPIGLSSYRYSLICCLLSCGMADYNTPFPSFIPFTASRGSGYACLSKRRREESAVCRECMGERPGRNCLSGCVGELGL